MNLINRIMSKVFKSIFGICQSLGFYIIPNHYYEPIPDTSKFKRDLWDTHSELPGIDMREAEQTELLKDLSQKYGKEFNSYSLEKTSIAHEYYVNNSSFCAVDAGILYSIIRRYKPARIFEIGSGFSTMISAKAVLANEKESGRKTELTAFEPYPNNMIVKGFPGLTKLVKKRIQDIDVSAFRELKENDVLFIDSSHVLKTGSDVQYEYLEILPRLNKGVLIHCHDIFLPLEYPREFLMERRWFWTEQYLLQAFLAFNDSFKVIWGGSYMNFKHPDLISDIFKLQSSKDCPGSFWMVRVK